MLIYSKVQAYYEAQNFEAGLWILPLTLLRGALYVAFTLWLLRSMRVTRVHSALAVAVMFPLLAGVAALIIPSTLMPADVRFWHALEIGVSNFIYGCFVGWVFWSNANSVTGTGER